MTREGVLELESSLGINVDELGGSAGLPDEVLAQGSNELRDMMDVFRKLAQIKNSNR